MAVNYIFQRFPEGKFKAVTFSYDDGARHDLKLVDTVEKYGMKLTLNLCDSLVADTTDSTRLSEGEIKDILARGHEVAVHGNRHIALGISHLHTGVRDVLDCRRGLEKRFGRIIRGFAYPDSMRGIEGEKYREIKGYLSSLGIAYARSIGKDHDTFDLPGDYHNWLANAHHDNEKLFDYIDKFLSPDENTLYCASRTPKVMFIWGHSGDFNNKGNWSRLDEICEKLSGKNDTWYATCIEIYEYSQAFNSLVFNLDNTLVHNPTSVAVWFSADGRLYKVMPGETIEIA